MIENEKQYEVTLRQISRLRGAIEAAEATGNLVPDEVRVCAIAGIHSVIRELEGELGDYDHEH